LCFVPWASLPVPFEPTKHSELFSRPPKLSAEAPVNLIYVCDYAKMRETLISGYTNIAGKTSDEAKTLFSGFHAGVIAQNIYLYCASEGLATVVRAYIDIPALAKAMELRPDQKITLGQPVGYPRKTS
jgi:nitroreductase